MHPGNHPTDKEALELRIKVAFDNLLAKRDGGDPLAVALAEDAVNDLLEKYRNAQ